MVHNYRRLAHNFPDMQREGMKFLWTLILEGSVPLVAESLASRFSRPYLSCVCVCVCVCVLVCMSGLLFESTVCTDTLSDHPEQSLLQSDTRTHGRTQTHTNNAYHVADSLDAAGEHHVPEVHDGE